MKFQTKEEVKQAAEESDEAALLCSIEHYNQMLAASEKELREARQSKITGAGSLFCGLCMRYLFEPKHQGYCPMKANCYATCFPEWKSFHELEGAKAPLPEIRAAMGEVRRVLQEKYDELYPRKDQIEADKKKEKPKFKPIIIHYGCFCVGADDGEITITPRTLPSDEVCRQSPACVDNFISALQKAKAFVEANK